MSLRGKAKDAARSAARHLPDTVRDPVRRTYDDLHAIGQLRANQGMLAQRLADLEGQAAVAADLVDVPDPRFPPRVRSRLCTQAQLGESWFARWSAAFAQEPKAHRKHWEFAYIAEVLEALGQLEPGKRGLGFGVGREPLVSAFAHRGIDILATDLDPDAKQASGWINTDQHASGAVDAMLRPEICDPDTFRAHVSWQAVDMRAIPAELSGFDFCWSACALEHLGSLAEGLDFVEASLATLKPGGIAVHTTEYNLSSNDDTIESGATVVYRERDLLDLRERLEASGHELAAYDLRPGEGVLDAYVDVAPYAEEPVLRFLYGTYTLTSVALVIRTRSS